MKLNLLLLSLSSGMAFAGAVPPPPTSSASVPPPPVASSTGSGFNYNYLQLDWLHREYDGLGTTDGVGATLSLSPVDNFLLYAGWAQTWDDLVDFRRFDIGAGVYFPIVNNVDIVVKAGYAYQDADVLETLTLNADSFVASLGFRIAITEWLEFAPGYRYELNNGDSYSYGVGSLLFDIGTDVQLSINGSFGDDESEFGAGIRYCF